jgi:hypothetical protein
VQIVAIQARSLDPDDAKSVAPLPIGHLATPSVPSQLLEQDVFRRVHMERPPVTDIDSLPGP